MEAVRMAYNKVVVIDVECTCWEPETPPAGQESEIIEIGVCLLSTQSLEISKPRRIFITPTMSTISEFCTKLTGITPEIIAQKGMTKNAACDILMTEYGMDRRPWAGWGRDEEAIRREFYVQPNGSYINIASLYGLAMNADRSIGLTAALNALGEKFDGIRHTGGADAYNAAKVLRRIIAHTRKGLNEDQDAARKQVGVTQVGTE